MKNSTLENTSVEEDLTEEEKALNRKKAKKIHEQETRKAEYKATYEEGKAGLKEHDSVPYDEAYAEAQKGLDPENDPNYVDLKGKVNNEIVSEVGDQNDPVLREARAGLTPDKDNPDFKPMYEKIKEFSFDFDIDPRYSFEQREKIENYTEALIKEIGEIEKMGEKFGLNVGLSANAKKKELENIARAARKKKFFWRADRRIINNLKYIGDPIKNAEEIIDKIKSQG